MLVECGAELAAGLRKVLLKGVCLESERIPFFLENTEKRRDGCQSGRARANNALGLDIDQLVNGQLFAIHWVFSMLGDVGLDQALLKYAA